MKYILFPASLGSFHLIQICLHCPATATATVGPEDKAITSLHYQARTDTWEGRPGWWRSWIRIRIRGRIWRIPLKRRNTKRPLNLSVCADSSTDTNQTLNSHHSHSHSHSTATVRFNNSWNLEWAAKKSHTKSNIFKWKLIRYSSAKKWAMVLVEFWDHFKK
jgi:hypothetical protein